MHNFYTLLQQQWRHRKTKKAMSAVERKRKKRNLIEKKKT